MEPPRKIISNYDPNIHVQRTVRTKAIRVKEEPRPKTLKRSAVELASLYHESKRTRVDPNLDDSLNEKKPTIIAPLVVAAPSSNRIYPVISKVFNEFWEDDTYDDAVSTALFAQICKSNCVSYGLMDYAVEPAGLPIIKVSH